jgi:hypothetical protein
MEKWKTFVLPLTFGFVTGGLLVFGLLSASPVNKQASSHQEPNPSMKQVEESKSLTTQCPESTATETRPPQVCECAATPLLPPPEWLHPVKPVKSNLDGELQLKWSDVKEAREYEIQVLSSSGKPHLRRGACAGSSSSGARVNLTIRLRISPKSTKRI